MALARPQDAIFAAVQNANAWGTGTATVVAALSKLEPLPPGILINPGREYNEDLTLTGLAGRLPFDIGNILTDFDAEMNVRYEGALNLLIHLWFGTEAVVNIDTMACATVGAEHTFNVATNLDGKHGTFAVDMINQILEVTHFKVSSIEFSWTTGERLGVTFTMVGRGFGSDPPDTAQVNDTAAIATVTLEGSREALVSENLNFRLNLQSAGALASPADDVCITAFTLTLDRQLDGPVTSCSTPFREEVVAPNPGWIGTLSIEVPRYDDGFFLDAHVDGDIHKAEIEWPSTTLLTGGDAGQVLDWNMDLPQLTPTGFEWTEQGTYGHTVTYELGIASAIPTGMNDLNPELRVDNERLTVYAT